MYTESVHMTRNWYVIPYCIYAKIMWGYHMPGNIAKTKISYPFWTNILSSSFFLFSKEALLSFCLRNVHNIFLYVFEHFSLGQYCSKHINMMCLPCQCIALFSQTVLHQTYIWAACVYNISDAMKGQSDVGNIFLSVTFIWSI